MKSGIYVVQAKGDTSRELAKIHRDGGSLFTTMVTMYNDLDAHWSLWDLLEFYHIICALDLSVFEQDLTLDIPTQDGN